jgi:S-formylglutathione hydrolase FrmB
MNLSIVSGWVPAVAQVLAVVALALAVDWRSGRWKHQIVLGVPIAVVVSLAVTLVLRLGLSESSDVPWSTWAWGASFVLAVSVALTGRRGTGWPRRSAGIAAVILTLLVTLDSVNQQTDTFPTVDRLITLDPENVVDTPELQQIRNQVAATGRLPSQGAVVTVTIPPTVSHFSTRPAYVYLPPAWFAKVVPSLPTLVLLPGEPGGASDWTDGGDADNTADAFAKAHDGVAPIIVMPDPDGYATIDSECVNSKFGNAESYLVEDVPTYARAELHASKAPGSLAIGGLSAGGTCSLMLALRHPTVYTTFASYSGFAYPQYQETTRAETIDTLFGGSVGAFDAHDPTKLLSGGHFNGLAGWFEVGDQDTQPLQAAHALQPAALAAGIATCIRVRPGGHDFDLWSQALVDSFPWLSWRLGLIAEPVHEPAICSSP